MGSDGSEPDPTGDRLAGYRVGVVFSERDAPSARLASAAERWLAERGARVSLHPAPAAFEVAQLSGWLAERRLVDALVACAAIVRGETSHDRVLGAAVTGTLLEIGVRTGVPVGNAVLTVETLPQAEARSGGGKGNRGEEAAHAVAGLLRARERMEERRALDLGPVPESPSLPR